MVRLEKLLSIKKWLTNCLNYTIINILLVKGEEPVLGKINVITIGREYASGGRIIGQKVAESLGVPFYNKEILHMAAERLQMSPEDVKFADETAASSLLYSMSLMSNLSLSSNLPLNDRVFIEEREVIKALAQKGPCVIVGRCADYALADNKDCFSVFIHADLDWKINHICSKYGRSPKEAREMIQKADKSRASYYNYYTNCSCIFLLYRIRR